MLCSHTVARYTPIMLYASHNITGRMLTTPLFYRCHSLILFCFSVGANFIAMSFHIGRLSIRFRYTSLILLGLPTHLRSALHGYATRATHLPPPYACKNRPFLPSPPRALSFNIHISCQLRTERASSLHRQLPCHIFRQRLCRLTLKILQIAAFYRCQRLLELIYHDVNT